ncbi:MAG: ArsR/SmtB family transcription factor [Sodaliphilus sp.]
MSRIEITADQERLARFAKAMGHPTRIAILRFLAQRDECFFGEIHEVLPVAKATVSQHLSELKAAGLIQGTIEAPKVRYCINRENWAIAQALFNQMFSDCHTKKLAGACCKS